MRIKKCADSVKVIKYCAVHGKLPHGLREKKDFHSMANGVQQENSEDPWTRIMWVHVLGFNLDVPELQLLVC